MVYAPRKGASNVKLFCGFGGGGLSVFFFFFRSLAL